MQGMAPVRQFPPGPNTSIESSRPDARTAEVAAKTRWRGRVRVVGGNRRRRCIVRHSRGRHNCAPFHPGLDQGVEAVANSAQARKRARQAVRRRAHHASLRSRMRTSVKRVLRALNAGDEETASAAMKRAEPILDGAAGKGLIHRNKAARHKSRLNARLKALRAT